MQLLEILILFITGILNFITIKIEKFYVVILNVIPIIVFRKNLNEIYSHSYFGLSHKKYNHSFFLKKKIMREIYRSLYVYGNDTIFSKRKYVILSLYLFFCVVVQTVL